MELRMKLSEQVLPESMKLFALSKSAVKAGIEDHSIVITPNYDYLNELRALLEKDEIPDKVIRVMLTSELFASTATILEQILYQLSSKYFKDHTTEYSDEQMMAFVEKHKMYK